VLDLLQDRGFRHTLASCGRKLRLLLPDRNDVRVIPELSTGILVRANKRETRSPTVSKAAFKQVLGAGNASDGDRAVGAGDNVLEVLSLGDDGWIGLRLEREVGESDEGVLLVGLVGILLVTA
jgi:hypothetical protein